MVGDTDWVESDDLSSASSVSRIKIRENVQLKRGMTVNDDPRRERHGKKPNDCSFHLVGVYGQL